MTDLDIRQRDENTWYYVLDKKGNEGQLHGSKLYDWSQVSEILGEVPSYDEWKASEKYNKHLEDVIKIYERKDKQATETSIAYNELLEENAQLKKLLGECLAHLTIGKYGTSVTPINILCDEVKEVLK